MSVLRVSNISKKFGTNKVLDNIDFVVNNLEIVGLAGGSGSGKSTLLRCIQKLETVDCGTIECNNKIGFVFQDFQLFPHMTVLENLLYAPSLVNKGTINSFLSKYIPRIDEVNIKNGIYKKKHIETKETHYNYAKKLLKNLGITDKASCYPSQLSGGQTQRTALARSLMMHPGLLLCDEPTSGLDIATSSDVADLLRSVRNLGITIIIASHDLDFLVRIANRIIVLKSGSIAANIEPQTIGDPVSYLKGCY